MIMIGEGPQIDLAAADLPCVKQGLSRGCQCLGCLLLVFALRHEHLRKRGGELQLEEPPQQAQNFHGMNSQGSYKYSGDGPLYVARVGAHKHIFFL
jgi:hypothetical protein